MDIDKLIEIEGKILLLIGMGESDEEIKKKYPHIENYPNPEYPYVLNLKFGQRHKNPYLDQNVNKNISLYRDVIAYNIIRLEHNLLLCSKSRQSFWTSKICWDFLHCFLVAQESLSVHRINSLIFILSCHKLSIFVHIHPVWDVVE